MHLLHEFGIEGVDLIGHCGSFHLVGKGGVIGWQLVFRACDGAVAAEVAAFCKFQNFFCKF